MMSNAPAVAPASTAGSMTAPAPSCRASAVDPPCILLVDDDELILRQLSQVLEHHGLRCVPALTPLDALVYCDRHRPHVIVTDLTMPQLDGGVLARWLKARYPSVPILLVTGQDVTDPMLEALLETVAEILPKPLDLDHLVDQLIHLAGASEDRDDTARVP
jgi:DNA-binding NtrC family response regulator